MSQVNITVILPLTHSQLTANSLAVEFAERFWSKVRVRGPKPCWLWTGAVSGTGYRYGQVAWRARYRTPQKAHRVAWELFHGHPVPAGKVIAHQCDVPLCCNPSHLFLATQPENLADARRKGRLDESRPRTRTLTLTDRIAIFLAPRDRRTGAALARQYGVSQTCIHLIRKGRFVGAPPLSHAPSRQFQVRGEVA